MGQNTRDVCHEEIMPAEQMETSQSSQPVVNLGDSKPSLFFSVHNPQVHLCVRNCYDRPNIQEGRCKYPKTDLLELDS